MRILRCELEIGELVVLEFQAGFPAKFILAYADHESISTLAVGDNGLL